MGGCQEGQGPGRRVHPGRARGPVPAQGRAKGRKASKPLEVSDQAPGPAAAAGLSLLLEAAGKVPRCPGEASSAPQWREVSSLIITGAGRPTGCLVNQLASRHHISKPRG